MKTCFKCRKELSLGRETGRRDECPFCSADLRCCLNCRFYDRTASKQCRETQADLVREKEKANFCDFFVFAEAAPDASGDDSAARKALDDLFRQ